MYVRSEVIDIKFLLHHDDISGLTKNGQTRKKRTDKDTRSKSIDAIERKPTPHRCGDKNFSGFVTRKRKFRP